MGIIQEIRESLDPSLQYIQTDLSEYAGIVENINNLHQSIKVKTDTELKAAAQELKSRALKKESLGDLLPEVYALTKEACIRQLGLTPYQVQLQAAIALHQGKLVEMQTGEGKTLAAVFPAVLNALTGQGVHILTFNDYLAKRDAIEMGKVYGFLGLETGYIQEGLTATERKKAYACDITYATAKEVGFDYLRSYIAHDPDEIALRPFHYCIVDEADAILIDEARTPLVLAGSLVDSDLDHYSIANLVKRLSADEDFEVDDEGHNVFLTEGGIIKVENNLGVVNLHEKGQFELQSAINLALHARTLLKRDVDYIVRDGEIKLIDEFTGRIVKDRKWRNGLQTAVEAKESVTIRSEGTILNSITLQHLLHKYERPAGMTATAQQSAKEFAEFYNLSTVVIPPNKPCLRKDWPDEIFSSSEAKQKALINEIKKVHKTGQPMLIGTLSVKESEMLAKTLKQEGLDCQVLNAKNDEKEASIIAEAGRFGAITISTNMAGRGTDIKLGGADGAQKDIVEQLGGLYVIGTNKHESARIDRQLKGRAGRQGDEGESRFFISFEDELMVRYKLSEFLPKKYRKLKSDKALENPKIGNYLNDVQRVIENRFFEMRQMLYEYASFLEKQRFIFQEERQRLLTDEPFLKAQFSQGFEKLFETRKSIQKVRSVILFVYDSCWAYHLDYMMQVREGIHLQRFGGQNPLRAFRKNADEHFIEIRNNLQQDIREKLKRLQENPKLTAEDLGMKRPSATWTYIISDNTYGDQLSLMLLDNSNIGFQVDFISVFFLAIFSLFRKFKKKLSTK
ncbi:MAG: accessory Sec system translocase SecA2 [Bacteroidetes bacterium]|nr:MAG: accessory Sec system translocase SecA2 [Bacteroidota bacterium]